MRWGDAASQFWDKVTLGLSKVERNAANEAIANTLLSKSALALTDAADFQQALIRSLLSQQPARREQPGAGPAGVR